MVIACTPLEVIPTVFELGKYKPVIKLLVKLSDGLVAEPVCKVMLLLLLVIVEIAVTFVPSVTNPTVVPVGTVTTELLERTFAKQKYPYLFKRVLLEC